MKQSLRIKFNRRKKLRKSEVEEVKPPQNPFAGALKGSKLLFSNLLSGSGTPKHVKSINTNYLTYGAPSLQKNKGKIMTGHKRSSSMNEKNSNAVEQKRRVFYDMLDGNIHINRSFQTEISEDNPTTKPPEKRSFISFKDLKKTSSIGENPSKSWRDVGIPNYIGDRLKQSKKEQHFYETIMNERGTSLVSVRNRLYLKDKRRVAKSFRCTTIKKLVGPNKQPEIAKPSIKLERNVSGALHLNLPRNSTKRLKAINSYLKQQNPSCLAMLDPLETAPAQKETPILQIFKKKLRDYYKGAPTFHTDAMGELPPSTEGGSLSINPKTGLFYVFGGAGGFIDNSLFIFDKKVQEWTKITIAKGTNVYNHTSVVYKGSIWIFGGIAVDPYVRAYRSITNNLLTIDMLDGRVTDIQKLSKVFYPRPRRNHIAGCFKNMMFVHGGIDKDDEILQDFWMYEFCNGITNSSFQSMG